MVTDGRGNRHQPKGVPGAGHFAPKGGAAGADDLAESTKFGMYRPHVLPGTMYGGALAAATRDGFDIDPYIRTRGGITADAGDMAEFRKELPVRPVAMGDREYGEAVTVEDGKLCLYSANTPCIPLLRVELEEGEDPRAAAYRELGRSGSVLRRFACDCAGRRIQDVLPRATEVDDDTVSVPTRDGGYAEIWFDGDTAQIQPYDENGVRGLGSWVGLGECGSVDTYMERIADEVNAIR